MTDREKYGGLYYLGLIGLLILIGLLTWFAWGVWSLRSVWTNVYILHDASQSEDDRVQAAYALGRSPDVNQRQLWEITLRKPLPPLARYLVAEGLTAEAVAADPAGYGKVVARSEGWPGWLRLILTRPIAYAATLRRTVPADSLRELAAQDDAVLALLARYALAASVEGDPESAEFLRKSAETAGPLQGLAQELQTALQARTLDDQFAALDRMTRQLRSVHPEVTELWKGWRETDQTLVRTEATKN